MLVRLLALAASAVVSLGPAVSAIPLEGSVVFNEHLPDISAVRPSTSVSLDHGAKLAYVLKDGSFSFGDIEPGVHTIQVHCATHFFQDLVVVLPSPDATTTSEDVPAPFPFVAIHAPSAVLPFDALSPPSIGSLPFPIELVPLGKVNHFTEQGSFQVLTMLKSPMILMMGASGIMMLGLPWLLKNMDPEALADAQKMMAGPAGGQAKPSPFALTSGASIVGEEDVPASPSPPLGAGAARSAGRGGRGGGKRKK